MCKPDRAEAYLKTYEVYNAQGVEEKRHIFYMSHPQWYFSKLLNVLSPNDRIRFNNIGMEDEAGVYMSCSASRSINMQMTKAKELVELFQFQGTGDELDLKLWRGYYPQTYEIITHDNSLIASNQYYFPPCSVLFECIEPKLHMMVMEAETKFPDMGTCFRACYNRMEEYLIFEEGKIIAGFPEIDDIKSFINYGLASRIKFISGVDI